MTTKKNKTGFYRVSQSTYSYHKKNGRTIKQIRWIYQVNNDLMKKKVQAKTLILLKMKVLENGLVWGITDLEQAKESAKISKCDIKDLQGKYGIQL